MILLLLRNYMIFGCIIACIPCENKKIIVEIEKFNHNFSRNTLHKHYNLHVFSLDYQYVSFLREQMIPD